MSLDLGLSNHTILCMSERVEGVESYFDLRPLRHASMYMKDCRTVVFAAVKCLLTLTESCELSVYLPLQRTVYKVYTLYSQKPLSYPAVCDTIYIRCLLVFTSRCYTTSSDQCFVKVLT